MLHHGKLSTPLIPLPFVGLAFLEVVKGHQSYWALKFFPSFKVETQKKTLKVKTCAPYILPIQIFIFDLHHPTSSGRITVPPPYTFVTMFVTHRRRRRKVCLAKHSFAFSCHFFWPHHLDFLHLTSTNLKSFFSPPIHIQHLHPSNSFVIPASLLLVYCLCSR